MRILLDSNAYTKFMRGDIECGERVRSADEVLMSVVVLGELLFGFRNGTRFESNYADLGSFLDGSKVSIAPVSPQTAEYYAIVATSLRSIGRPIPTNDLWIAAHALETQAELISEDRHFEAIEGIALQRIGNG